MMSKLKSIVEAKNGCVQLLKILGLIEYNKSIINEMMSRIIFKGEQSLIECCGLERCLYLMRESRVRITLLDRININDYYYG